MTDANTPAWRTDPTGRHAQRWFDGTIWTEHVADAHGTTGTDPLATQPATPDAPTQAATAASPVVGTDPTTIIDSSGAQSDPTAAYTPPATASATPAPETQVAPAETQAAPLAETQATPVAEPPADAPAAATAAAPDPGPTGWAAAGAQAPTEATPQAPAPDAAPPWGQPAPAAAAPVWGAPPAPGTPPTTWGAPPAPGQAPPWGAPPPPVGGTYGQPAYGAPAGAPSASGTFNPAGLIVVVIGAALAVVGLFALKWIQTPNHSGALLTGSGNVHDIKKLIDFAKANHVTDITFMSRAFVSWGQYVALVVALVAALGGVFVKALKPVALVLGLLAAAWCLFFAFDIAHWIKVDHLAPSASAKVGAYLAAAGFVVAGIGALLPSKRS